MAVLHGEDGIQIRATWFLIYLYVSDCNELKVFIWTPLEVFTCIYLSTWT